MSATRKGMSSAEIGQIVAQRVIDAIESISIYEIKIRMTHDLRNQVIRQETTIEKNANNKRNRPQATSTAHRGTYSAKDITYLDGSTTEALISRGMADALVEQEIQRNNNLNGDGSQGSRSGITRPVRPTRKCTYTDFLKCQPMNLKGTKGVVGLTQWFERIETVFNISNCAVENQVKISTCTLHGVALTWWKSYVMTVGQDAAHGIPWNTLMKMMTAKYCPRNEIKKLKMAI
ncbi:hypothetical protein Tco_0005279 [Tanacetum coccineum]